jgi:iron only hydrogenase large subunit-like protein
VDSTYLAYFETLGFSGVRQALITLGMHDAYETAEGAQLVQRQLEILVARAEGKPVITSGCPSIVLYAEKHFPEALPYLAPVLSPMQAHAQILRQRCPGAVIVYISPCIARKEETKDFESVGADYAITFDELASWLNEAGITVRTDVEPDEPRVSHGYVVTGGVEGGMTHLIGVDYLAVDTLEDCIKVMKCVADGGLNDCVIEMSACHGNCIGGMVFHAKGRNLLESRKRIVNASMDAQEDYDIPERIDLYRPMEDHHIHRDDQIPDSAITGILRKMGKLA